MKTQTRTKPTEALRQQALQDPMSEWCAPSSLDAISEYSLEIINSHDIRTGNIWEGHIYKGDTAILWVDNEGNGGCNSYHAIPGSANNWRQDHKDFLDAAKLAYPTARYEQDDQLVCFLDVIANAI